METILITGASSGIGRLSAIHLAEKGHQVVIAARNMDRLEETVHQVPSVAHNIHPYMMDVSDSNSVNNTANLILEDWGHIDVLVNNAGYGLKGPLELLEAREIQEQFQTNVFGLMELTRLFIPEMRKRCRGKIINISSVVGRIPLPFNGAYSASKFALEGLSENLRLELAPFGISVSIIEPGYFDTAFVTNQTKGIHSEETASPYKPYQDKYLHRQNTFGRPAKANKVAVAIGNVIASKSPKLRYLVGVDAHYAMFLKAIIPDRLFNYILGKILM